MWALPLEILIFLSWFCIPAKAEIFRWHDRSGAVHFTDNLQSVPEEYRHQIDSLNDSQPPPPPAQYIPLEHGNMGYVVRARLNHRRDVRLILDTGATSTVLAPRILRELGVPVHKVPPVTIHTANGSTDAGWAELENIEVGGRNSGPLRVVVHDAVPGADGLLGMNYLSAYRVEIRGAGPHLLLSPQ